MPFQISLTIVPETATLSAKKLEELVLELKDEIEHSSSFGPSISETHRKNDGTLGPEWVPVLTAILSPPIAVEAVKGLVTIVCDWMRRRKPVTVTIEGPKGRQIITGTNMTGDEIGKIVTKIT